MTGTATAASKQTEPQILGAAGTLPGGLDIGITEIAGLPTPSQLQERATVLVLSEALTSADAAEAVAALPLHVVVVSTDSQGAEAARAAGRLFMDLTGLEGDGSAPLLLAAAAHSEALLAHASASQELGRVHGALEELNKIGMALMSERDPDRLLDLILTQAKRITTSDAGSLYLVEEDEAGDARLRFTLAQTDSLPDLPTPDFTLPLDRSSVAGFAASTGEPLVIDDAYEIPEEAPYSFNRGFDEDFGYRAKSMLVVPMMDHLDRVVGVLQLINRKNDPEGVVRDEASANAYVLPFGPQEVETVQSLAGQAAVSIENGQLYQDIENLFEGFITAAVTAIDQRDPTTSGHSVRVTELTCDAAELMHRATDGPFKDVSFTKEEMRQLRYAGLLHDFGKVGVREEVLVKERKLPPTMEARVQARFGLIREGIKAEALDRKVAYLEENGSDGYAEFAQSLNHELAEKLAKIDEYWAAVEEANLPRVLAEEASDILDEIAGLTFTGPQGDERPYLTPEEVHYLKIPRGNLDENERAQIQSHVVHSYDFLLNIPWTDDLARIAEIVRGHHEKLDGTGYPDGVTADEIPLETKIMTVADIFDALTASDRPYKKAMPTEKALQILKWEAEGGQLDPDIVELFVESELYRKILDQDWRELVGM